MTASNEIRTYALPGATGPAIDSADGVTSASQDILGRPRGSLPDLGAYERTLADDQIFVDGFESLP